MTIAILGGGAFGTALAMSMGQDRPIMLWARDISHLAAHRESPRLAGVKLPENVTITAEIGAASQADIVLFATPMQSLATFVAQIDLPLTAKALVACCKGLDLASLKGPTDILASRWRDATPAILTGPSFATDIAHGLPTALTLACADEGVGTSLQGALSTSTLRLYRSTDVVGAELGGALKNVIAIAAGIVIGAGLGDSARAALMTRGFAELSRFALRMGARSETLMGLSGFGDLVLTCSSTSSRNFSLGKALGESGGEGRTAADLMADRTTVAEGAHTAPVLAELAQTRGIAMPITAAVNAILAGEHPRAVVAQLLARPLTAELPGDSDIA